MDVDNHVVTEEVRPLVSPLFREAAIQHHRRAMPGNVLSSNGFSLWFISVVSLLFASAVVLFIMFGQYTRRVRVDGQVQLTKRVAHIYAAVDGTVVQRCVSEGQSVAAGQALFVIDSDKRSVSAGETQEAIVREIDSKLAELFGERSRQLVISDTQIRELASRSHSLSDQLYQLQQEAALLDQLWSVNNNTLERYEKLTDQGYFPVAQLEQKRQENINIVARIASAKKVILATQDELNQTRSAYKNLPLEVKDRLSTLDQKIDDLRGQLAEAESHRKTVVYSAIAGHVTAPLFDPGQSVSASTLLVSVIPADAMYVVDLYVPSKAIGFVSTGAEVAVRYDSFPYEKFGQYFGRVVEISHSALPPGLLLQGDTGGESLYRLRVQMAEQAINAYGKAFPLSDGMRVDADVMLETRKMYEWILEPLYAITNRYAERQSH